MTGEVLVTVTGRRLRRMVGPTAWVVLECLVADASADDDGEWVVATSVRGLAGELGLGRDAVASAVQALAVAGLVRVESSRASSGRFGASRYVVTTDALRRVDTPPTRSSTPTPPRPRSHEREQLTLLDALDAARDDGLVEAQTCATPSGRPAAGRRGLVTGAGDGWC